MTPKLDKRWSDNDNQNQASEDRGTDRDQMNKQIEEVVNNQKYDSN